MKTAAILVLILTLNSGCHIPLGSEKPVILALPGGVEHKLIPIRMPDGSVIYYGETEVTNAMWQSYLTATGEKRVDDVELLAPLCRMTPAEKEAERRKLISDGWGDPRITDDDESGLGGKIEHTIPPEHYVKGEDSIAGFSSCRDESVLWRRGRIPDGKENYPVTFITVKKAYAFCRWLSTRVPEGWVIRLPTPEEWVWAAYGGTRKFPWGNKKCEIAPGLLYPVKAHPELNTPEGLFNMYGNASEFIHTKSDGYGGRAAPDEVPYITQWMGTDAYEPWNIPRKDYFGYVHINNARRDYWGFRIVMGSQQRSANQ